MSYSAVGMSYSAVGMSYSAVGMSYSAVGMSYSAVGMSYSAVGMSYSAVGMSYSAIGIVDQNTLCLPAENTGSGGACMRCCVFRVCLFGVAWWHGRRQSVWPRSNSWKGGETGFAKMWDLGRFPGGGNGSRQSVGPRSIYWKLAFRALVHLWKVGLEFSGSCGEFRMRLVGV